MKMLKRAGRFKLRFHTTVRVQYGSRDHFNSPWCGQWSRNVVNMILYRSFMTGLARYGKRISVMLVSAAVSLTFMWKYQLAFCTRLARSLVSNCCVRGGDFFYLRLLADTPKDCQLQKNTKSSSRSCKRINEGCSSAKLGWHCSLASA